MDFFDKKIINNMSTFRYHYKKTIFARIDFFYDR